MYLPNTLFTFRLLASTVTVTPRPLPSGRDGACRCRPRNTRGGNRCLARGVANRFGLGMPPEAPRTLVDMTDPSPAIL